MIDRAASRWAGWPLTWKTIGGKEYLYRPRDRLGNARSHGRRSDETEQIYDAFTRTKAALTERLMTERKSVQTHARVNAALRLGTLPSEVADVCAAIDRAGLTGRSVMVIGTNVMHAYGFLAGVRFDADIMATTDIDLLWGHKSKLTLAAADELLAGGGLLGLLKQVDKSYEIDEKNSFRARASSGFMVDLIRQMPRPPWANEPDRFFDEDLLATDIRNMDWLLSAPRLEQAMIALDGRVVSMTVPDPRAFAAFKCWLAASDEREPLKKRRDAAQADAIVGLINERLPHLGWLEGAQVFDTMGARRLRPRGGFALRRSVGGASAEPTCGQSRRRYGRGGRRIAMQLW